MITPGEFKTEVMAWADIVGVKPKEIHIRKMKKKWGSCSSKGRLTFNAALLNESKKVRWETILHELLHLRYPKHGKMFNRLLETYSRKSINDR